MPHSVYLILIILAVIAAVNAYDLIKWARWNTYRKLERRTHVNLGRMAGR